MRVFCRGGEAMTLEETIYDFDKQKVVRSDIHPEVVALRQKFLDADRKVFQTYNIDHFVRDPYEGELEVSNQQVLKQSCQNEECVGIVCYLLANETRGLIHMNKKMFTKYIVNTKPDYWNGKELYRSTKEEVEDDGYESKKFYSNKDFTGGYFT